jgi:hypothetical protein
MARTVFGAGVLALLALGCAGPRSLLVVDTATEAPATICWYAREAHGSTRVHNLVFAAWDDGRIVCRGFGGWEGELGRASIDPAEVARARDAIVRAIEDVPPGERVTDLPRTLSLTIEVRRGAQSWRTACCARSTPSEANQSAYVEAEEIMLGLILAHCRAPDPPAPGFPALEPASLRLSVPR